MLYIFLVDTGTMLLLEMDLALEKVSFLTGVLARRCCIPIEKQVLLISGGESLDADERVCKYNAGTDTNPIFLFSLVSIDSPHPPEIAHVDSDANDEELARRVEVSLTLPDAQSTVSNRATIAQDYVRASEEQIRICETLIHDQHLQHQGWQAVVANLEDAAIALDKQRDKLSGFFKNYLAGRERYREMVETFDDDVAVLHRIPVFQSLLDATATNASMVGSILPGGAAVASPRRSSPARGGGGGEGGGETTITLLEWINSRGSSQSLEKVADSCYRSIENLAPETLDELDRQVVAAVEGSKLAHMKEIRGLSERLLGLEEILREAKRRAQEQQDLAQAFLHNQQRASGLRDKSILPDLCASHKQQLRVMAQNYQKITSIRKRSENAKNELAANLHPRMKWIVKIQDQLADKNHQIMMYCEEIRRLDRKLEIIEQLHAAPSMYIASAVEVVRRRAFSERYLQKANVLSDSFAGHFEEELKLRKTFQSKLRRHFLSKMFPGMDDVPPPFATKRPEVFDNRLPTITLDDVSLLRQQFPDLAKSLQIPEEGAFANLLSRSINQTLTKEDDETLSSLQNMSKKIQINSDDIGSVSVMHKLMSDMGVGNGSRKKNRGSKKREGVLGEADSETDTDDIDRMRVNNNGVTGGRRGRGVEQQQAAKRSLFTQSLPLDQSAIGPEEALSADAETTTTDLRPSESFEFRVDTSVDPSCSSADPSSSSGANTGNNSSVAPSSSSDGSVMKQTGEESTLLQQLSPQSHHRIDELTSRLQEAEASHSRLRAGVQALAVSPPAGSGELSDLKASLSVLRQQLLEEKANFVSTVESVRSMLGDRAEAVQGEQQKTVEEARIQERKKAEKLKTRLEVQGNQLEDCQREIDIYRHQLQDASEQVEKLKADLHEAKESRQRDLQEATETHEREKEGLVQKLTLDHEFELDALRESTAQSDRVEHLEGVVQGLKEELQEQLGLVDDLRRKTRIMENTQEDKFHQEKDKIVHILEAGFSQREKLAVQNCTEELGKKHDERVRLLERQHDEAMSEAMADASERSRMEREKALAEAKAAHEGEVEVAVSRKQEELDEQFRREKKAWEDEKDKALKSQGDRLTLKAKREVESLRSRFKIMQTAGALDRSPSASESELSIESPKSDMLDNIRSALVSEHERNMVAERVRWERQMTKLREEHKHTLEALRSKEKVRDTAERQVHFNEALKKAVEEKDKQLRQSNERNKELEEIVAGLKQQREEETLPQAAPVAAAASAEPVDAELQKKNDRLESELAEIRGAMSASVFAVPEEQLTTSASTSSLLTAPVMPLGGAGGGGGARISVTSINRGDSVMIVWSEEHCSFVVYSESPALSFLHSDCFEQLGLSVANGAPNKRYLTAEVVDKEYCQAKKPGNRFRVAQGTKFYRVKCRPTSSVSPPALDAAPK